MENKKKLMNLAVIFFGILLIAGVAYSKLSGNISTNQLAAQPTAQPGEEPAKLEAMDFTVYDADGNEVHLADYFGKPIVLNFWASWCGPCKHEMPDFHAANQELDGKVQFLMINMTDGKKETVETASEFIEKNGYTLPVFFDTEGEAAYTYGAYSLPTTYFIDADGYVIAQARGAIDAETLQVGIDMIYTPEEA